MENAPPPLALHRIKRIAPLSVAEVLGILYVCMGLLFAPVLFMMASLASHASNVPRPLPFFVSGIFAVFAPVFYGAMGFIGGLISAAIYNLIARMIGGIEFEVE
jgi:hypothetical protein